MAIQETGKQVITPISENKSKLDSLLIEELIIETQVQSVEEKIVFVDNRINEHFQKHGLPSPADFLATTRTLRSAFSIDIPRKK